MFWVEKIEKSISVRGGTSSRHSKVGTKFRLKLNWLLKFWSKLTQKGHFGTKKMKISLSIKFHFERTILNFWTKFAQRRYLWSKVEKWTSSLNSAYSNYTCYQISAVTDNFDFFDQIYPKKVFLVWNRKSEHHIFST